VLVYANRLVAVGPNAREPILKAVGAWLKEQLGFGLHPAQLTTNGEFRGDRGNTAAWLRIIAACGAEPELCAWILKHPDERVPGRQWVVEVGLKAEPRQVELSCVVSTDEQSALVEAPVDASQPRVVAYAANNVRACRGVDFAPDLPGVDQKTVGTDLDTYRGLGADIVRPGRDYPIVLVSPGADGGYLVPAALLQQKLVGLAQVVTACPGFNSYEMAEILGRERSAWDGAVNIIFSPTRAGVIRNRLFRRDAITAWGGRNARVGRVLAQVTSNTNIPRLRLRIRPEGIALFAQRRRFEAQLKSLAMVVQARGTAAEREGLEQALADLREQVAEHAALSQEQGSEIDRLEAQLEAEREARSAGDDRCRQLEFQIESLKHHLSASSGAPRFAGGDMDGLVRLAARAAEPSPEECLWAVGHAYGDNCVVLESARHAAAEIPNFKNGRRLLGMLVRLVTDYRAALASGGDAAARQVFGKEEFSAKESESVMNNPGLRRLRTFDYNGSPIEMYRHLKIGKADNTGLTIRVHFHWDAELGKIVIGYCGKHLDIASR
jgi:hypothetical protein